MRNNNQYLFAIAAALFAAVQTNAHENSGLAPSKHNDRQSGGNLNVTAACNPGTAKTDLDINNVRTTLMTCGDMWWDLNNAQYEVPKGGKAHSIFAGSLWIGGVDAGGQLKVAAMTYRQSGLDFWPGPLDTVSVSVTDDVCNKYDKHFKITRKEVEDFVANSSSNIPIPQSILQWPAMGDPSKRQAKYLAPFFDANGDGFYNPADGDYPGYDLIGEGCVNDPNHPCTYRSKLFGDQTLWWVFNDKGNIHTETGAEAIGLELQTQGFAFTTNDEVNNMTFYQYRVINRSTYTVKECYFGQWTDADLGDYSDDFVGCDVKRGLGYTYNADAQDGTGGPGTYGLHPPAIGLDFFQGPIADPGDGIDNNRNCITDEPCEQIIMSRFVYYINDWSLRGNPENGSQYYGYLKGLWKDGTPLTYGGNGYMTGAPCNFMFPSNPGCGVSTDEHDWGVGGTCSNSATLAPWDEACVNDQPGDRRMLQSAGPFTLKPGAVNIVTVGAVWGRSTSGDNIAAIPVIQLADDKAQALFDNCFQVLNGPDAPDLTIQELDKELLIYLSNKKGGLNGAGGSNNFCINAENANASPEDYSERDPLIINTYPDQYDTTYNFQGYQIFQLKDATVSVADIQDISRARLVAQCDVKDGVKKLVNFDFDPSINANVPTVEVDGADEGIFHSVSITQDQFAIGDKTLINHKTYYFLAISYAYNNFKTYDQNNANALDGQKKPYKAGRRNIKVYSGIPHIPSPEAGGTVQQSTFGMGPKITRIEGQGNDGNFLDLTDATVSAILSASSARVLTPQYKNSMGPVKIKVIDPLNVPDGNFTLKLNGSVSSSNWKLIGPNNVTDTSDKVIGLETAYEQIFLKYGLSVSVTQMNPPGTSTDATNGFIDATKEYTDPSKDWLDGLKDGEGYSPNNWIRSGSVSNTGNCVSDFNDLAPATLDANQIYENVLGGTWAPYRLCANTNYSTTPSPCYIGGPAWDKYRTLTNMKNLASVDLVITKDPNMWTRCVVFEMAEETALAEGGARKLDPRKHASVDRAGKTSSDAGYNAADGNLTSSQGMGWFPGYAINVETGERLNMAFSENSWLAGENGRDMVWNPTHHSYTYPTGDPLFGGMHYIYIFGHNSDATPTNMTRYDAGARLWSLMDNTVTNPSDANKRSVFADCMWVGVPLLKSGYSLGTNLSGAIPSDVKFRFRVKHPYASYYTVLNDTAGINQQNMAKPMYTFSTSDILTKKTDADAAKNALDLINVVPNPYYAYSAYEKNQLDNRIKFTNLPDQCTISIYTLNGTLIRKLKKDDPTITSVDWDLKNKAGIPIASGLYIIHVDVPGVGEKILKFFGVMRPIDLDSY